MGQATGIEWTDATWNPIRGCSMVSAGCAHCYAQTVAHRFSGPGMPYEGLVRLDDGAGKSTGKWNGVIRFVEERLLDPLRWKKPRRIFVNSMSDLFHENVTDEMRDRIFAVMALCPQHTFQVLTKRPERMLAYQSDEMVWDRYSAAGDAFAVEGAIRLEHYANRSHFKDAAGVSRSVFSQWPLPNVWLGVSVEDQKTADARIPLLLQTPAAMRFVSAEPLLGAVDLEAVPLPDAYLTMNGITGVAQPKIERDSEADDYRYFTRLAMKLDWVICGGESGPGARPMHPDWARSLRDQCKAAEVPFFFKQWGEWAPLKDHPNAGGDLNNVCFWDEEKRRFSENGIRTFALHMCRVRKKAAGHLLDGEAHREFPLARRKSEEYGFPERL